jgi:hypothetical protein
MNKLYAEDDANSNAYKACLESETWQKEYDGQLVAFYDGKFVCAAKDADEMLVRLAECGLGDKPCMINKVGEEVVKILSPKVVTTGVEASWLEFSDD